MTMMMFLVAVTLHCLLVIAAVVVGVVVGWCLVSSLLLPLAFALVHYCSGLFLGIFSNLK